MSNEVFTAVKRRKVGSPTMKSVMLYMADSASDDGSGIWVSKATMAADLEFKSKRTVQGAIGDLMAAKLVSEVGQRGCSHGYTIEYRINLDAVMALPVTRARNAPVPQYVGGAGNAPVQEMHPTPAPDAPHGVQEMHPNHPLNHKGTLCPANADTHKISNSDFEKFVGEFVEVYPRCGDLEAIENELQSAVENGVDPAVIMAGAKAYAEEQAGNKRQYTAFAENWLAKERWEQHSVKVKAPVERLTILQARADAIREGRDYLTKTLSPGGVRELITAKLITEDECRKAGVQF